MLLFVGVMMTDDIRIVFSGPNAAMFANNNVFLYLHFMKVQKELQNFF
jgi:hypothetical protein